MDLARFTGQRPSDVRGLKKSDIAAGYLAVKQGKTQRVVRISVEGKLEQVIRRITSRKYEVSTAWLCKNEKGELLGKEALQDRLERARLAAGVEFSEFQFRDLRAKAGTRQAEKRGMREAQDLLGHTTGKTTEIYVRNKGKKVRPAE
jgi:integrase